MIYLHRKYDEFADYLISSVKDFTEKEGTPIGIGISLSESMGEISLHYNLSKELNKANKLPDQFEFKNYQVTSYKVGKPGLSSEANQGYRMTLWEGVRNATKLIALPTVLCCFEDSDKNYFPIQSELELLGRTMVKYFRGNNLGNFNWYVKTYSNVAFEDLANKVKENFNEFDFDQELKMAKFFNSISGEQIETLKLFLIKRLDETAFNILNVLDESRGGFREIQFDVKVNGINALDLNMIGNGNLSGEYLDWVDRFSEFGIVE